MAEKYLANHCKFSCSFAVSSNSFIAQEVMNQTVKVGQENALTNSANLICTTPGITTCSKNPNPSGTPPFLPCSIAKVKWLRVSKNCANGYNLLTDQSCAYCVTFMGKLTTISGNKRVLQGQREVKTLKKLQFEDDVVEERKTEDRNKVNSEKTENKSKTDEKKKGVVVAEKGKKYSLATKLKCPYSDEKKKCETCAYKNSSDMELNSSVEHNSVKLRQKYIDEYQDHPELTKYYDTRYRSYEQEIALFVDNNIGNEAHHILSTNDVFKQKSAQFVVKLANYYGYDINSAINCILLAANIDRSGNFKYVVEEKKIEEKYRAMSVTGRQWHGGGHRFFVDDCDKFEGDYATLVTKLLVEVMDQLSDSYCRNDKRYYEVGKQEFIQKIEKTTDFIRKKLISFENDPKKSWPYYVSAEAIQFAYGLPTISKFLVMRTSKGKIVVEKYVASRKNAGNNTILFEIRAKSEFDIAKKIELKKMIFFCEQIDIAIIDIASGEGVLELPFTITNKKMVSMNSTNTQAFLEMNEGAISVFLGNKSSEDNKKVIARRLRELG